MFRRAIHHDLSTAFVDLCAMVRHLRRLQFVGNIRIEMSDYEADITFTPGGRLHAREHDHAAGTFAEGDRAFRNILFRAAREPMGRIHVFDGSSTVAAGAGEMFVDDLIRYAARQSTDAVN